MDDTVYLIGAVFAILSSIAAVVFFFVRVGGKLGVQEKVILDNSRDIDRAHEKIRAMEAVQAQHATDIAVIKTNLEYIKDGIDEIKMTLSK